ncbi:luxR family protein regulatory protein [Escherichia coli H263]|nr:luxR family protein regulatory protein [Escherichia coli H263]
MPKQQIHRYTDTQIHRYTDTQIPFRMGGNMDKFKEKNPLSLRERQVLRMLAQGDEYSQISHNLNISINTVKFHVKNIKHKIQARNTNHAIHIANRNEII